MVTETTVIHIKLSFVFVLGAEVEDSGRIGCRRLGDSDDDNIGYVDLKVFGKTRFLSWIRA